MAGKGWWQELEAVGYVESGSREMKAEAPPTLSLSFSPGPQPMDWCHLTG